MWAIVLQRALQLRVSLKCAVQYAACIMHGRNPIILLVFFASRCDMHATSLRSWSAARPAFNALLAAFLDEISPIYVVGGAARDALMQRQSAFQDLDIVLPHAAIPIARRVADRLGWAFYTLDEARDVARLLFTAGVQPLVCDVIRMRGGSIDDDLRMRDFTVNAIAFEIGARSVGSQPFRVEVIDPVNGQGDIRRKVLRRVAASSLASDPVRMLRAVRFAMELDFAIDAETSTQILRMPASVRLASPERMRDELWKMLAGRDPAEAVDLMRRLGMLPFVLPEVANSDLVQQSAPHDQDVYRHTLAVTRFAAALREWLLGRSAPTTGDPLRDRLLRRGLHALEPWSFYLRQHFSSVVASGHTRAEWLVWCALLHDVGKPTTRMVETTEEGSRTRFFNHERVGAEMARQRLEALHFSRIEVDSCCVVIADHMRPHHLHASFAGQEISRRARFRFFRDIGIRGLDRPLGIDVLMLSLVDFLGTNARIDEAEWNAFLVHVTQLLTFHFSERAVENVVLQPLVDGRALMEALSLSPGPVVGLLLDELGEAQAAGEIGTRAEAIAFAQRLVAERNLQ